MKTAKKIEGPRRPKAAPNNLRCPYNKAANNT